MNITHFTGPRNVLACKMFILFRLVGFLEDCEEGLRRAQFNLECPGAASTNTDTFDMFFDTLNDECDDRTGMISSTSEYH